VVYTGLDDLRTHCSEINQILSYEEKLLGGKKMLKQRIQEITAVPVTAFSGNPSPQFSVAERLRRVIPLIWGEGDHAFIQLKEEETAGTDSLQSTRSVVQKKTCRDCIAGVLDRAWLSKLP
jgi:hypothetical protein